MYIRILIINLLFIPCLSLLGQTRSFADSNDCEEVTLKSVNLMVDIFKKNELNRFDSIMETWIKQCDLSECAQRLLILKKMIDQDSSMVFIQTYLKHDFHRVLRNRVEDAENSAYSYYYNENKAYFGYVPLRHPIDSLVKSEALKLLDSFALNPDERLICIMFSGNATRFDKEVDKSEYNNYFVKQHLLKSYRELNDKFLAYTLYAGFFHPLNNNDIFKYSPSIGFSISSPINNKFIVEIGMKIRININDDSFIYYALDDSNKVNSDVSVFFGVQFGYKIAASKNLILIPKIGIGLETVDTGIESSSYEEEESTYYNLETAHFSIGLTAMKPVFKKGYTGIGINYHYCPYQIDNNLLTKIYPHLFSAELVYRF